MMPPGEHSSGRGRGDKRGDIIRAALRCFSRKGYNKTTMDDIVAQSGLSKGTLYWYFDSKDDLFNEAMMSVLEDIGGDALRDVQQCSTASGRLRAMAQAAVSIGKKAQGFFSLFLEFWGSSPHRKEVSQLWLDLLEEYKDVTAAVIEEGVENGEFAPVEAEQLVWAVLAAYDGLAAYITLKPDLDLDRINEAFIETLLKGLLAGAERE